MMLVTCHHSTGSPIVTIFQPFYTLIYLEARKDRLGNVNRIDITTAFISKRKTQEIVPLNTGNRLGVGYMITLKT